MEVIKKNKINESTSFLNSKRHGFHYVLQGTQHNLGSQFMTACKSLTTKSKTIMGVAGLLIEQENKQTHYLHYPFVL